MKYFGVLRNSPNRILATWSTPNMWHLIARCIFIAQMKQLGPNCKEAATLRLEFQNLKTFEIHKYLCTDYIYIYVYIFVKIFYLFIFIRKVWCCFLHSPYVYSRRPLVSMHACIGSLSIMSNVTLLRLHRAMEIWTIFIITFLPHSRPSTRSATAEIYTSTLYAYHKPWRPPLFSSN